MKRPRKRPLLIFNHEPMPDVLNKNQVITTLEELLDSAEASFTKEDIEGVEHEHFEIFHTRITAKVHQRHVEQVMRQIGHIARVSDDLNQSVSSLTSADETEHQTLIIHLGKLKKA